MRLVNILIKDLTSEYDKSKMFTDESRYLYNPKQNKLLPRESCTYHRYLVSSPVYRGLFFIMKDAYYFQHDSNARNDPKIKALIRKYGIEGYGRYWIILEMLRESSNYKLEDEQYIWDALAEQMHCSVEEIKDFIKDCINIFKLFTQDDDFFYSAALLLRMTKLDNIREKRRNAAETRWQKESWDD